MARRAPKKEEDIATQARRIAEELAKRREEEERAALEKAEQGSAPEEPRAEALKVEAPQESVAETKEEPAVREKKKRAPKVDKDRKWDQDFDDPAKMVTIRVHRDGKVENFWKVYPDQVKLAKDGTIAVYARDDGTQKVFVRHYPVSMLSAGKDDDVLHAKLFAANEEFKEREQKAKQDVLDRYDAMAKAKIKNEDGSFEEDWRVAGFDTKNKTRLLVKKDEAGNLMRREEPDAKVVIESKRPARVKKEPVKVEEKVEEQAIEPETRKENYEDFNRRMEEKDQKERRQEEAYYVNQPDVEIPYERIGSTEIVPGSTKVDLEWLKAYGKIGRALIMFRQERGRQLDTTTVALDELTTSDPRVLEVLAKLRGEKYEAPKVEESKPEESKVEEGKVEEPKAEAVMELDDELEDLPEEDEITEEIAKSGATAAAVAGVAAGAVGAKKLADVVAERKAADAKPDVFPSQEEAEAARALRLKKDIEESNRVKDERDRKRAKEYEEQLANMPAAEFWKSVGVDKPERGIAKTFGLTALDVVAKLTGTKAIYDVPMFLYEKFITNPAERDAIAKNLREISTETRQTTEGSVVLKQVGELRELLASRVKSGKITRENAARLEERITATIQKYDATVDAQRKKRDARIGELVNLAVEQKVSALRAGKEVINTALVWSGLYAARAMVYGGFSIAENFQKFREERAWKDSDERKSFEFEYANHIGATFTKFFRGITFRGGETRTQKALGFVEASGKVATALGMVAFGVHELSEYEVMQRLMSQVKEQIGNVVEGTAASDLWRFVDRGTEGARALGGDNLNTDLGRENVGFEIADAKEAFTQAQVEAAKIPEFGKEQIELATVRKGDGFTQIFMRQFEANPEEYGYDKSMGSVREWARGRAIALAEKTDILQETGELRLGTESIGEVAVVVHPDGESFSMIDVDTGKEILGNDIGENVYGFQTGAQPEVGGSEAGPLQAESTEGAPGQMPAEAPPESRVPFSDNALSETEAESSAGTTVPAAEVAPVNPNEYRSETFGNIEFGLDKRGEFTVDVTEAMKELTQVQKIEATDLYLAAKDKVDANELTHRTQEMYTKLLILQEMKDSGYEGSNVYDEFKAHILKSLTKRPRDITWNTPDQKFEILRET